MEQLDTVCKVLMMFFLWCYRVNDGASRCCM